MFKWIYMLYTLCLYIYICLCVIVYMFKWMSWNIFHNKYNWIMTTIKMTIKAFYVGAQVSDTAAQAGVQWGGVCRGGGGETGGHRQTEEWRWSCDEAQMCVMWTAPPMHRVFHQLHTHCKQRLTQTQTHIYTAETEKFVCDVGLFINAE